MELNTQTLIAGAALIGAAVALYKYFANVVRYVDHQKEQDKRIEEISKKLATREEKCNLQFANQQTKDQYKIEAFREEVNSELCVINYGLLACLKGLQESGCDGPVTDAINKLEKHLNQKAHRG